MTKSKSMSKSQNSQPRKMKTKRTKRTKKTKRTKMTRGTRARIAKLKLTVQQPTILYSKDPRTGEETVARTATFNQDGVKTFMARMNSRMPPTVFKRDNGSSVMSMSQKRAMVVQSYTNMNQTRLKTGKTKRTKKH